MNANHPAEPLPTSGLDDVDMVDKIEPASNTSIALPASAPDHGDVAMDQSENTTGPSTAQTGNDASLTTTADSDPMDTTLSSKTIGDTSSNTDIEIWRAPLPPGELHTTTTYAGKKRKYRGISDETITTHPLDINTAIFNMAGSAFDAELSGMLEDGGLKIDEYTYQNPLFSTYSFKGQEMQDWVPHVVKQIRHRFFSELKNGEYVPKWHDGFSPDFQETYRNVVEFTMSSSSVWELGPCLLNAMMPVMVLEKKLAIEPSTIDATQISKEMLHSGSLPSQEARRTALWRIFEALVHAHLRMTLYLAQRPDSRRILAEFVAAKWDFLEQKALDLEHQCAMNSVIKGIDYDIDAIVTSFGDSSNSFARNIAQFIAEHHSRPYSCKPCSYMSSVDAYKDYHKDRSKFIADDGVIEMMLMIRVNAPHVQKIRYSRDTHVVTCATQRLANVREIYARLTLADDLWLISMDSTIFAPCAVDDVYDTKGPRLARIKLAEELEMSPIKDLEAMAAKLKPEGKRVPSSYTALYESKIRGIIAPLIDRPTETLKLLAIDSFDQVRNSMTMDPRKFQHDSPRSNPFEVEDWKRGWGPKEEFVERIDQPRIKHRRRNKWQKTRDDGIQREWKYMAPRLGMSKLDERPWAIPGMDLNYDSHLPSLGEFLDALRAPEMRAG